MPLDSVSRVFHTLKPSWPVTFHSRIQHAVGQGGFHTGELSAWPNRVLCLPFETICSLGPFSNDFRYVYDCGSKQLRHCRKVVKLYSRTIEKRHLDFLFLSHFDEDHVNGVPDLLETSKGVKADTIVMPWVDAAERLIALARVLARKGKISAFFEDLIIDPKQKLLEYNPRRILFIDRGPSPPDADDLKIGPLSERPDGSFQYELEIDGVDIHRGQPRGTKDETETTTEVFKIYDDVVIVVSVHANGFHWLLKPYVRPAEKNRVENFKREAEKNLGWNQFEFDNQVKQNKVREDLVRDSKKAKKLAKAYTIAFGDRNLTSLCLYSGPSEPLTKHRRAMKLGINYCSAVSKIGWLGTGDAQLRDPGDTLKFCMHYDRQRVSVTTFALPHHGAVSNYSPWLVTKFRPTTCVASSKPPRHWLHPHPMVIADVVHQGAQAVRVSDAEESAFHEVFAISG